MGKIKDFFNFSGSRTSITSWGTSIYPTSSGVTVTDDIALQVSAVYAAIHLKASTIAKLPLQLFKTSNNGRERDRNHQIAYLLEHRPNKTMSPYLFKYTIFAQLHLHGVFYIRQDIDKRGIVQAIYPMNPPNVSTILDEKGNIFYDEMLNGVTTRYTEDEVIKVMYLSKDGITPRSPLQVARENVGLMKQQMEFLGSFFQNGTLSRGLIKTDKPLDEKQKKKLKDLWHEANSGENRSKVAVLDAGLNFEDMTLSLADQEFLATYKFSISEIARIFGIPPHLIGDLSNSTFSNIEQQSMDYIQHSIEPLLVAFEDEANYKLFTKSEQKQGYYLKFNMTSALRADSVTRSQVYKTGLEAGYLSINEVREKEEMNRVEGGDAHRASLNYVNIEMVDEYQKSKAGVPADKGGE